MKTKKASLTSIECLCCGTVRDVQNVHTQSGAKVAHYDITGGDGPYANDRGQIMVVNNTNGSSDATVTLSS